MLKKKKRIVKSYRLSLPKTTNFKMEKRTARELEVGGKRETLLPVNSLLTREKITI